MRILRSAFLASAVFLSASAFAPAPTVVGDLALRQTLAVRDDPLCQAWVQCVGQCPTNDVHEWEACKAVCDAVYPCILGE